MKIRALACAFLTLACTVSLFGCSPPSSAADPAPVSLQTPWQQREGLHPVLHRHTDGFAVSPSGRFIVAAPSARPGSEVAVIDIGSKSGLILQAPDARILLAQPAISPDEKRVALIATPLGRFGVSEIWLVDIETGEASIIGDPDISYTFPAFSPDGRRIAYFRDVDGDHWNPGEMRPEYRTFLSYALFQRDLNTGVETPVAGQPFQGPCGLFYDTLDRGLFYCALDPLVRENYGGATSVWALPNWAGDYLTSLNGAGNFFVRWGEDIPQRPRLYAPADEPLTSNARLAGAISGGRVFLRSFFERRMRTSHPGAAAIVYDGRRSTLAFAPGLSGGGDFRSSFDGETIVAVDFSSITDPDGFSIIARRHGGAERISIRDISFSDTVRHIRPTGSRY